MGYLKDKRCYLTGPITAVADDGRGWRQSITPLLNDFGIIVDDPTQKTANGVGEVGSDKLHFKNLAKTRQFEKLKKEFWPIVRKDLRSVDHSDFLIFYYDPDIPMLGTIHEIVTAHNQKKPILMYIQEDKLDRLNPWILTFIKNEEIFVSWTDLFNHLQDVNENRFNTSYWTL